MPKLYIAEGGQESVFELFDDEVSIGRGAANEIQIVDAHASKHQAVIRRVGGRPKLVDLESKNGTRVNGAFVNQRWLEHGDTVTVGAAALRYDASEQLRGASVVQFRGAPAPRVAAAPSHAPHPAAAAAYAPPAAYTPPPSAPAPARAASSRRRDRDEEDDEDGPRQVAKRPSNSAAIGILAGAGVIAGVALLFFLLSRGGGGAKNVELAAQAERISKKDKAAALALLKAQGDPSQENSYVRIKEMIDSLSKTIADEQLSGNVDEAYEYRKVQIINASIEQWKTGITNAQLAERIVLWRAKYADTPAVMEFDNSPSPPYPALRALVQQNAGGVYNFEKAFADQKNAADADLSTGHYGDALHKWSTFRDAQKTLLVPDEYRTANNRITGLMAEITQRAEKELAETIQKANDQYKSGNKLGATITLDQLIGRIGIAKLVQQANDAKAKFR